VNRVIVHVLLLHVAVVKCQQDTRRRLLAFPFSVLLFSRLLNCTLRWKLLRVTRLGLSPILSLPLIHLTLHRLPRQRTLRLTRHHR
jgi:hypothetical protein